MLHPHGEGNARHGREGRECEKHSGKARRKRGGMVLHSRYIGLSDRFRKGAAMPQAKRTVSSVNFLQPPFSLPNCAQRLNGAAMSAFEEQK
jgi:hypothetical protein